MALIVGQTFNMNIYEHGIAADNDEWGGSLGLASSTDLPVYWGLPEQSSTLKAAPLTSELSNWGVLEALLAIRQTTSKGATCDIAS